ncbi:YpoC family protein [Sporosarcina sp. HYO08]|uniref:YpoC family protein n=1 Tax=Sporosarcina sp. HYO08 TaxID=1759557 RepID=UPI0012E3B831|nr:hypothetical protein [Sporosarcina sp. HYO08]
MNNQRLDRQQLAPFFEQWEAMREEIEAGYANKNRKVVPLMEHAINNFEKLLAFGGKELNERSGKQLYILLPLNGEERLDFIKKKITSHYAFVQLDALYTETKKKAARLAIQKR